MIHHLLAFSTNFFDKEMLEDSFSTIMLKCIFELLYSQSAFFHHLNFFNDFCFSNFYLLIFIVVWMKNRIRFHQIQKNHHIAPFKINFILYSLPSFLPFILRKNIGAISKSHDISKFEHDGVVNGY